MYKEDDDSWFESWSPSHKFLCSLPVQITYFSIFLIRRIFELAGLHNQEIKCYVRWATLLYK